MGVENSLLERKNQSHLGENKIKKKTRHKSSKSLDNKNMPNLIKDFHREEDIIETRPKSKTIRIINPEKKRLEIQKNSIKRENVRKNNQNFKEATDSHETNCGSNKSKEDYNKMLNDELYDVIDDNNSVEEDDEEKSNEES